ncbi:MAG TPA: methyltransferase domain-containing protein [Solirubrobacteraceae bacterium]|nr:methyltransferase domain-containing protein [Solirubrobacteraceae bacterium]
MSGEAAGALPEAELDAAIAALALPAGGTALDVRCRDGDVLARVKRRHAVTTMGIEPSAREAAVAHERVDLVHAAPLAEVAPMEGAWDLVVCIDGADELGGREQALAGLRRLVRPGGAALFGERVGGEPLAGDRPDRDAVVGAAHAAGWRVEAERAAPGFRLLTLRAA